MARASETSSVTKVIALRRSPESVSTPTSSTSIAPTRSTSSSAIAGGRKSDVEHAIAAAATSRLMSERRGSRLSACPNS